MSPAVTPQIQSPAEISVKVTRWKPSTDVTELFPPQAFLLREEGGAGQLGDGHHQDEGRMTFNGDINTRGEGRAHARARRGDFNEQSTQ